MFSEEVNRDRKLVAQCQEPPESSPPLPWDLCKVDGIYHDLVTLNAERGYKVNSVGSFNLKLIYCRDCMRGNIVSRVISQGSC
jgi:hypothetical protein